MSLNEINEITYIVRGCVFEVFNVLGPGLLESVYEKALAYEIQLKGLSVKAQVPIRVVYKDTSLDLGFRIDLLVEEVLIVEVKSVEAIHPVHKKQLLTYLRLTGRKLGLLVNFNVNRLEDKQSIVRVINGF